jgi:hypothetical protein
MYDLSFINTKMCIDESALIWSANFNLIEMKLSLTLTRIQFVISKHLQNFNLLWKTISCQIGAPYISVVKPKKPAYA